MSGSIIGTHIKGDKFATTRCGMKLTETNWGYITLRDIGWLWKQEHKDEWRTHGNCQKCLRSAEAFFKK